MKRRRVIVAPIVLAQIRTQVFHIARDSIDNALAWEDRLHEAIKRLGEFSGYAKDEDASDRLDAEIRKLVFEQTYLVHFIVQDDEVQVINFRHGARLPERGEP